VLYFALCFLFLLLIVIGHFKKLRHNDVSKFMSFEEKTYKEIERERRKERKKERKEK
jgi:hypothetical protein